MSSTNTTINQLNTAAATIVLVLAFINFTLGAFGLIFNVLIFTRRSLRREPCSLYFFWSSCFDLFVVYVMMPLRTLASSFNLDIANYNLWICKIEYFANYTTRAITCWLIVFACLDRFFHSSTNANIRRMSSLKTTKRAILIIIVTIMLLYSHMLVYFEITNVPDRFGNIVPICNAQKGIYRTFLSFWYMALYSLCPSLLMLLFGILTLNNLRQHRQIVPTTSGTNQIVRRTDNQLLRMLIAQVLMIIIATLPYSIYQLYTAFTSNVVKDILRIAQENLAARITGPLINFAHTTSFYLYTLTGTVFRKELRKIMQQCRYPNRRLMSSTQGHTHILPSNQKVTTTRMVNHKNNNSFEP
ncbi:unnamed protein product [Adineta steineri]|uniref:G-protein coupled receptors family 1 profile domain-containing protein n=1 Tax=Adineta steineri TaxID=433720 RepID=A0A815UH28_9BILA|nr:unnamed protein product [Adineta steineri]CAF3956523.1 unnamed protein product [Adineta steineri]